MCVCLYELYVCMHVCMYVGMYGMVGMLGMYVCMYVW